MSPLVLLVSAALAAASPPAPPQPPPVLTLPPATLDDALEVTGEGVDARVIDTRMVIPVQVNGQGSFPFVVDSGADRTVIGAALARRLALPTEQPLMLRGMAGSAPVPTVRIERMRIGTSDIDGIVAPALPERHIGAQGLLGIDVLVDQRLMLDFVKRTITIQDSRVPAPAARADEIVVTARRRRGQLILTQLKVADRAISAVIDTGTQVTVGNMALLARIARGRTKELTQTILISVTGQAIAAQMAVLPEMRIGRATLRNVPVAFVDAPPFALFGLAREPALLIGNDVLEVFARVSLDFRERRVRFAVR